MVTLARAAAQVSVASSMLVFLVQAANPETTLPKNAFDTKCLSSHEVKSWLDTSRGKPKGYVRIPENGKLELGKNKQSEETSQPQAEERKCAFFKAAEHMFLWLASPAPNEYGGGSHVFNSPIFYEVSPPFVEGGARWRNLKRVPAPKKKAGDMVARSQGFDVKIAQTGPLGGAMVFDTKGGMHELRRPTALQSQDGQRIDISRTSGLQLDLTNKTIQIFGYNGGSRTFSGAVLLDDKSQPIVPKEPREEITTEDGTRYWIDEYGNAIDLGDLGVQQADRQHSVLMTQPSSGTAQSPGRKLVYYAIRVNDVYAHVRTAVYHNEGAISGFPTSTDQIRKLVKRNFRDLQALVVELKMAFVDVRALGPNFKPKSYIRIQARVPIYEPDDSAKPTKLVFRGFEDAELALVGMHVVFSAKGHPEMLWATFEHIGNSPNVQYHYTNDKNNPETRPRDSGGPWLFSTNDYVCDYMTKIQQRTKFNPNDSTIYAVDQNQGIAASDVCRMHPWGGDPTYDNTLLININQAVQAAFPEDARRNYLLIGTTWSKDGKAPVKSNEDHGGTWKLSNSTMETFVQDRLNLRPGELSVGSNCLVCHRDRNDGTNILEVSRIWSELNPLRKR